MLKGHEASCGEWSHPGRESPGARALAHALAPARVLALQVVRPAWARLVPSVRVAEPAEEQYLAEDWYSPQSPIVARAGTPAAGSCALFSDCLPAAARRVP